MSIKEFTKAAKIYDSGKSGIYEMCKYDYPKVLKELKNKKFNDVLDCGCGTGPMIEILCEKYPDKLYTGLDLTPEMIKKAFENESFDVIICTNSFHHYPNPQDFFDNAYRVLRKGEILICDGSLSYM
ncbi:class I SAM-dependent methyltransferase [Anaerostipes sp.]|jgi:ubiquinone/menaquinone biosynthesis C-methylase UbiE|uniref:class I SAM-dependent methyltransferase n=1 Tax=Anaerostipes sp. TaxID=1872530 RepID=UPI00352777B0